MIQTGRYFHIGNQKLYKSLSYVGNIVFQYQQLLEPSSGDIHGKVFYLADYEPLSLRQWADEFQKELEAPPIKTIPETVARLAARIGDFLNNIGYPKFPFNTFRLRNVLAEYIFDLKPTQKVCGPLPYGMKEGVKETAAWLKGF